MLVIVVSLQLLSSDTQNVSTCDNYEMATMTVRLRQKVKSALGKLTLLCQNSAQIHHPCCLFVVLIDHAQHISQKKIYTSEVTTGFDWFIESHCSTIVHPPQLQTFISTILFLLYQLSKTTVKAEVTYQIETLSQLSMPGQEKDNSKNILLTIIYFLFTLHAPHSPLPSSPPSPTLTNPFPHCTSPSERRGYHYGHHSTIGHLVMVGLLQFLSN